MNMTSATIICRNGDTVIFNKGDDAHIKQLVSYEIKRNQKQYADEQEWNDVKIRNRDKKLAYYLDQICNITPVPLYKRITDKVCFGIDYVIACFIVFAEYCRWIEYIGEDKKWR